MDRHGDRSPHAELDGLVRRALEPEPGTVDDVVARALQDGGRAGAPRPVRLAPRLGWAHVAAVVVLLAGGTLGATLWWRGPAPAPIARGTISNEGDIIVVIAPDRPITLIGSGSPTSTPPPGTASIVLLGEPK